MELETGGMGLVNTCARCLLYYRTWNQASKRAYDSLLYDGGSFPRAKVHLLYKTLRMVSTVGRTQAIDITGQREYDTLEFVSNESGEADAALKRMEWLAKSGKKALPTMQMNCFCRPRHERR